MVVNQEWRQKLLNLAEVVDSWRVFPRIFLSVYLYLLLDINLWYTTLQSPSDLQYSYLQLVWGVITVLTAWYMSTGRKWGF